MTSDAPQPTPAEKKFDQAREDAFSNEGAPPPSRAGLAAANADRLGADEDGAVAPARSSTGDRAPAGEPADRTGDGVPDALAMNAMPARTSAISKVAGICSLLSRKLADRGC